MIRFFVILFCFAPLCGFSQSNLSTKRNLYTLDFKNQLVQTGVTFDSQDTALKQLFDIAEAKAKTNIYDYTPNYRVMVEGGGYPFVWLETQPMGGVMYAKRDIGIALNNILIFTNNQRNDGLLAGMIYNTSNNIWNLKDITSEDGKLGLHFNSLQGLYLAQPALELYYLLNHDKNYLDAIYSALEQYDNYLWKYRDSDHDGCLETWAMTDNGEDHLERFRYAPWDWDKLTAPDMEKYANISDSTDIGECPVPEESMDVMGYSYSCRDVLAKISAIRKDGKETFWRNKANEVSNKMKDYLWVSERKAYFYRNRKNEFVYTLAHNNIRAMYFGTMDQTMADDFIRYHLLNPFEFWTPMPLPSIAANDPFFRNIKNNNWSGQSQGLTYQRAIRALVNYGHYAEVTLIGSKLLNQISKTHLFTQQFDPFTGVQNGRDNYGPAILATLEYFSRMYGVYLENGLVHYCGLSNDKHYTYTQKYGSNLFKIKLENNTVTGTLDEKELFRCTPGVSVITDINGKVVKILGIDTLAHEIKLSIGAQDFTCKVDPNCTYVFKDNKLVLNSRVPFDYPYKKPE